VDLGSFLDWPGRAGVLAVHAWRGAVRALDRPALARASSVERKDASHAARPHVSPTHQESRSDGAGRELLTLRSSDLEDEEAHVVGELLACEFPQVALEHL
jgi:hypothetical protein